MPRADKFKEFILLRSSELDGDGTKKEKVSLRTEEDEAWSYIQDIVKGLELYENNAGFARKHNITPHYLIKIQAISTWPRELFSFYFRQKLISYQQLKTLADKIQKCDPESRKSVIEEFIVKINEELQTAAFSISTKKFMAVVEEVLLKCHAVLAELDASETPDEEVTVFGEPTPARELANQFDIPQTTQLYKVDCLHNLEGFIIFKITPESKFYSEAVTVLGSDRREEQVFIGLMHKHRPFTLSIINKNELIKIPSFTSSESSLRAPGTLLESFLLKS